MSKIMPSVDQVAKCDEKSQKVSKIGAETTHKNGNMNDKHTQANGAGAIAKDQPNQNGHTGQDRTVSKSVNAHLVKTDVICLDRSPVKPVVLDASIKTENGKMEGSKQVENGAGAEKQNGSAGTSDEKHNNKSERLDVGKDDKKLRKTPKSFDLLGGEICKQCKPSKKGKLARQRATSDMSYQKQHHHMVHTNSDPTGLADRDNVFEGAAIESFKCEKDAETKVKKVDESSEKKDKDIDQLAESLGSSLQIKTDSDSGDAATKEKSDKKVSDLADDLNKISVKDEASSRSKVGVEKKDTVVIIKQEPSDSSEDTTSMKKPNVVVLPGKDTSAGKFSDRVSSEDKKEMLSRGVNQVYPSQAPASGNYFQYQQRGYPTSSGQQVSIPSFQTAFVNNNIVVQQQPHEFNQQRVQLQPDRIQHVTPPCYRASADQQIVLPSSTTASKPIIVPSSSYQMSGQQYNQQQLHMQVTQLHQSKFVMPLQEPQQQMMMSQLPSTGRQPQESTWPNDMASSPPQSMDDNDPIMSPPSVSSDTSSVGYPVSPRYSNQGSPQVGMYTPLSPYQTVPTRSPEQPPINSPQAPSPSPASPYSQHTVTAGNNFGTVMVTDETPTAKRQCIEDPMKENRIKEITDYLQQGSPVSTVSSHEGDQDPSASPAYQPFSPASCSISSGPPTPSPAHLTQYQPEPQPSPTPGVSPATAAQNVYSYGGIPPQALSAVPQGYVGGYQMQLSPQQTFGQAEAVVPTQTTNQQGYELEEYRQKVGQLSDAHLMEQDEDQDTILHVAICHEQKLLIQTLVERVVKIPGSINMKNKLSQTPLYLAAATNQPDFVEFLISNGADPTIPADRAGNTPLHHAAEQGYVQVIEAIFSGYLGRLGRIPDGFADAKNFEGKSALHIAVESHGTPGLDHTGKLEKIDSLQTIKMLMKYGSSAMCPDDKSGKTSLHYAVEMHKGDVTRLLLDLCDNAGELVNCQMYNGNTALHLIVGRREVQMEDILRVVSLLMRFGANVSIENAEKDTPVRLVQRGHEAIKKHLAGQSH